MKIKPKILIVDDRPENLIALETVLRNLDVELVRAHNGNDALKATLHHDFILALLDVQMPGMDGYELAAILREEEKTNHLPFVFISAVYRDDLNIFKGYEKGAFSFITKPFRPEILINKVKFFLEKHQQEVALQQANHYLEMKNEELRIINAELDAFSYSASHDLRSPLRSLKIYTQMLADGYAPALDERANELLNKIQKSAVKMGILLDDLLSFSKLGKKQVVKTPLNMSELLWRVIKEVREAAPTPPNLKINELHPANGDETLIGQVRMNLLSNALKYSGKKDHPEIEIGSSISDDMVTYYIRDNGVGFDMEYSGKLFSAFQRLHNNNEFEGTGLGLAIVEKIILRHGGSVWAESVPGQGATFYFTLTADKAYSAALPKTV